MIGIHWRIPEFDPDYFLLLEDTFWVPVPIVTAIEGSLTPWEAIGAW